MGQLQRELQPRVKQPAHACRAGTEQQRKDEREDAEGKHPRREQQQQRRRMTAQQQQQLRKASMIVMRHSLAMEKHDAQLLIPSPQLIPVVSSMQKA